LILLLVFVSLLPGVSAEPPDRTATLIEVEGPDPIPHVTPFDEGTFWDLRPAQAGGRRIHWAMLEPGEAGLGQTARDTATDKAICESPSRASCRLIGKERIELGRTVVTWLARPGAAPERVDAYAAAEGIALTLAGPREVVVLREPGGFRFVTRDGMPVAEIDGHEQGVGQPFAIDRARVLDVGAANDGMSIPFIAFRNQLRPGTTGFLQYSAEADNMPLTSIDPAWSSAAAMISIDQTDVSYQPDAGDPGSSQSLPEVWDFTGLVPANLGYRTFNTTRSEAAYAPCFSGCSTQDTSATPPDGTWQSYLKIDIYAPGGALYTQDYFALNDNDAGANPSIDVPFVQFDVANVDDRTQLCFAQSAGGANRLLRFFRFTGADPVSARLGVGDTWTSGAWTECDDSHGLRLTLASTCGNQCYPGCGAVASPRARGRIDASGAGFRMTAIEDGWVHMPTGNYVPAILLRQDTDLLAGVDFIGVCALSPTPNRAFDYFWVSERYGLLATASSQTSDTISATDWTVTDGVDFTWGPFPPYQAQAQACLNGTRISWSLPVDGSNLSSAPGVSSYGYVVSWGTNTDPEALADWSANANHSPLPGDPGYLAAPAGAEPTSYVIQGWAQPAIQATVVTALRYTDPNAADQRSYRSAAFFKVAENPAKLNAATFVVGNGVVPLASKSGSNVALDWPAVAGASSYLLRVWNLDTRTEIPCPAAELNCTPATNHAVHTGALATPGNYGYRVFAVDPCGAPSGN
jgi:hypothetical protein